MLDTSVSLLERIASRGEDDDWQRLLNIYRPFIDIQVSRYPQLHDQSDDIAQEIAIVLMRELPTFQRQRTGSFRAWLRQIAINQLRVATRKSKTLLQGDIGTIDQLLDELSDPASQAAKRWDEEHDQEVLRRVIEIVQADVNPVHWRAFQAYVLDQRPAEQVAEELGVNVNVIHTAKSRITKRMRIEVEGLIDS